MRDEDINRKIKLVQYFSHAKNRFIHILSLAKFCQSDLSISFKIQVFILILIILKSCYIHF